MKKQASPFKFLDSYQLEDGDVFFGREKEIDDLYEALSGVKHLLVYGPSGAGKTSLIECGLRNQFSDADWFALTIRRGTGMTSSVYARINDALEEKMNLDAKTNLPKDQDLSFGKAIEHLFGEKYQPVYLLFDQFEELLILGTKEEKEDFFYRLNNLIRFKVPCRVMLIMREEFIGHLSEFEYICPSIFQHRFRLEKMGRTHVREVIFNMLKAARYDIYFQIDNPMELTDSILAKLPDEKREIELTHLQVFLSELWERANIKKSKDGLPILNVSLIKGNDNLEEVLDSFLKGQLKELEENYSEKLPLELLAAMISERHTKLQLSEMELIEDLKAKEVIFEQSLPKLLKDLEQRRIIRTHKSDEHTQYEISHDLLALVVGRNLTEEMKMREKAEDIYDVYLERQGYFSEEDLDYIRPFQLFKPYPYELKKRVEESDVYQKEEKEKELKEAQFRAEEEERLRGKAEENAHRAQQRTRIATVVSVLALISAGLAYSFFNKAQEQTTIAQDRQQEAEIERKNVIVEKAKSDSLLRVANEALLKYEDEKKEKRKAIKEAQKIEAQKVLIEVENLLERAEYIRPRYPKQAKGLEKEAIRILKLYRENPILKKKLNEISIKQ